MLFHGGSTDVLAQSGKQRQRLTYLGHFRRRRKSFERARQDHLRLSGATSGLAQFGK
jgi:hypothetical protein